jgi:hypothetical protein
MSSSLRQQIENEIGVLNAGWALFPIYFKDELEIDGDECLGVTDFDNQTITIRANMSEAMIKQTLIHEMWHVIWSTMGLRTADEDPDAPITTNQEFLVEQTTRGSLLYQSLNPRLWRLLYEL